MPRYLRRYDGEHVFLTLVTAGRRPIFQAPAARKLLSTAMRKTREEWPWQTTGIALMPDHLHMLWRLPDDDHDYSRRITSIKRRFTRAWLAAGGSEIRLSASKRQHRRRGVWQRRFWEHTIRDAKDHRIHLDYIHLNPVRHGLVEMPADWRWSSFARYVRMRWYPPDWLGRVDLPGSVEYIWPQ